MADLSFDQQMDQLMQLLNVLPPSRITPKTLGELIAFARDIPQQFYPASFARTLADKFGVTEDEVLTGLGLDYVRVQKAKADFEDLIPQSGWLRMYMDYTRQTEPPTVYHFFVGLTVVGATLQRNVYFPRGSGDIFPNVCAVLVGPPGKCKKTTACNLGVGLFRRTGGNVLADKITPEAIVESFRTRATATGLIYAPEWAVFLGKQQYMEGLVPMLTALFDCPSVWSSSTIMRGDVQLQNVALSHLAATTIDWMQTSITRDAFAGGFMSRLLFIVQHTTERCYPLPSPLDGQLAQALIAGLVALQHSGGRVTLTPDAEAWYDAWYRKRQSSSIERHFAGYYERKPDRLLQIAMVLNASQTAHALSLDALTLKHAERILNWIEQFLPSVFDELSATQVGDDQHRLLLQIRKAKGELSHSEWLRMNANRMNADNFRKCVDTLKQAKLITFDVVKRRYYLLPAGWQGDV